MRRTPKPRPRAISSPRWTLSVATAAESLRLTRLRYTGGEATVLEVVDAQTAFVTAQNAREDGRVRYEAALAQSANTDRDNVNR